MSLLAAIGFSEQVPAVGTTSSPLAMTQPLRSQLPARASILTALFLLALVPRAIMAWRADVICEDGPVYIEAAKALEAGNLDLGFSLNHLGLNTYPILLLLLHKLGLDWFDAGRIWGVLAASLVVLPLFGWVRRQLCESLAILSCILYAFHPTLVERSPEVLRCPTYWLLLVTTLYFLWRAVTEVRPWQFVAAGITLALALHTRMEAWFLLTPWILWSAWRLLALAEARGKLAIGAISGLAMTPLLLAVVNMTWLADRPRWETCFSGRMALIMDLASEKISATQASHEPETTAVIGPPSAAPAAVAASHVAPPIASPELPPHRQRWTSLALGYLTKLSDAFDPVFGLLVLVGLATHWRLFLRRDQQAAFCLCLLHLLAIAAFVWLAGDVVGRYFFPVAILSSPYAALGLLQLVVWLSEALQLVAFRSAKGQPVADPKAKRAALGVAALLIIAALGWGDALTNDFSSRRERQDLGRWIEQQFGPMQLVIGAEPRSMTLAHYCAGVYLGPAPDQQTPQALEQLCRRWPPSVAVLWKSSSEKRRLPWLAEYRLESVLGSDYQRIEPQHLPPTCHHVEVYVCRQSLEWAARRQEDVRR